MLISKKLLKKKVPTHEKCYIMLYLKKLTLSVKIKKFILLILTFSNVFITQYFIFSLTFFINIIFI